MTNPKNHHKPFRWTWGGMGVNELRKRSYLKGFLAGQKAEHLRTKKEIDVMRKEKPCSEHCMQSFDFLSGYLYALGNLKDRLREKEPKKEEVK